MPLTDTTIRNAKPRDKPYRMFDAGGLYLEVAPSGGKWWRLKYRVDGKEKRISLGTYPDISLKDAREKRDKERKLLASGIDPGVNRKAEKASRGERALNSFEVVGREWFEKFSPHGLRHTLQKLSVDLNVIFSHGWATSQSPRSLPQSCWPCCERLRIAVRWKPPIGHLEIAARYSVMPLQPVAQNAIFQVI